MSLPQNFSENDTVTPGSSTLRRQGCAWTRISLYLMGPLGVLAALWITAGRSLFGAGGSLVPVFAISFGPALAVLYLLATYYAWQEVKLQRAGVSAGLPLVTALVQVVGWLLAAVFGLLVPDRVDGVTVSAASALLGHDLVGLSAGFGNTAGILTFAFAIAVLLLTLASRRKAKEAARGIDDDVREQLERQESMYDFLD
ncbi:hypothetical protein [Rothia endophytica]